MNTLPLFLAFVAAIGVISAVIILIVSKLNLGLEVDGFGSAFVAAIVIAVVGGGITVLLSVLGVQDGSGFIGGLVHLAVTAVALWISGRFLRGLQVHGFAGALVAAVAIGAIYWLGGLLLGALV